MRIDTYTDLVHLRHPNCFYLGGEWRPARGSSRLDVIRPSNERRIAQMPEATAADIGHAVACDAFDRGPWPRMTGPERGAALLRAAAALRARRRGAAVWTLEVGTPVAFASAMRMSAANLFEYFGGWAQTEPLYELRPPSLAR